MTPLVCTLFKFPAIGKLGIKFRGPLLARYCAQIGHILIGKKKEHKEHKD